MSSIIKGSKFYNILIYIYRCFNNLYNNSILFNLINIIKLYFYNSYIFNMFRFYENNLPIFIYSKTVNIFKKTLGNFMECVRKFISSERLSFINDAKVLHLDCEYFAVLIAAYSIFDWIFRKYIVSIASIWDELFLFMLYFLWICKWITNKKKDFLKTSPFDMVIILFIMIMFIMIMLSSNISIAFQGFRAIVQGMFWYFAAFQLLKDHKSVGKVVAVFVIIAGILSVYGIYQYIVGAPMPSTWVEPTEAGIRTRVYSIFTSPNIFGCLLVMAIPMCLSMFLINDNTCKKIFLFLILMFMCICILFTYSRGAWIGILAAMGMYIMFKDKKLIILFLFILLLIIVLVPSVSDRFMFMFSESYISSSLSAGRMIRWIHSVEIWKNNPLIGLGLGSFGGAVAANNNLSTIIDGQVFKNFYTDNYYMKILVEAGTIGIISFVFLMWQVVSISLKTSYMIRNTQNKELTIGIISGLVGVLIHCFVENIFEVPMMGVLFWLFVATIAHLWYINNENLN